MNDFTVTVTPGIIGDSVRATGFDIASAAFKKHGVSVSKIVRQRLAS